MNRNNERDKNESYSPGDAQFHYSREDRYKYLSPDVTGRGGKKKGIFRGNRGLIILLVDILFILLLYFILNPILQRRAATSEFQNYELQLRAFSYEDEVFMSLRFICRGDGEDTEAAESTAGEGPLVRIGFSLDDGDAAVEKTDILPMEPGAERVIRARLEHGKKTEQAFANVSLNDETLLLETKIEPEQE